MDLHTTCRQGLLWGWDVQPRERDVSKEPSLKLRQLLPSPSHWELGHGGSWKERRRRMETSAVPSCASLRARFAREAPGWKMSSSLPRGQVSPRDNVPLSNPFTPALLSISTSDARQNREYIAYLISSVRSLAPV